MAYVDLELCKKHLNIESDFVDDDNYITILEEAAEQAVEKYIDFPLQNLEDSDGNLPAAVNHAILLLLGTWYNTRESVGANLSIVPNAFELLCNLFRDYKLASEK